jgi:hypothetical protein
MNKFVQMITEEMIPHGIFHGSNRAGTYTFYGDGGQQITVKRKHNMPVKRDGTNLKSKMTAEELVALKADHDIIFNYYPRGKLF